MTTDLDFDNMVETVVDDAAETVAAMLGLASAHDAGNRLRLLALVRDATTRAIARALNDAARQGYSSNEIGALHSSPKER